MKLLKYSYLLIFNSLLCLSQKHLPNIIPPSPNASSILKFSEVPISYHKGTANINIPFYETNLDGVNLNISIQYDTRGIKVGEISSNIGAGWSLISGGIISRQVRDRPDENFNGYLTFNHIKNFQTSRALRDSLMSISAGYSQSDTHFDEYPDLYFISFLGKSGKFIFDNYTKKPVIQGFEDLKIDIEFESNTFAISRIIVTDNHGVKYYFGKGENNLSYYDSISKISSQLINNNIDNFKDSESGYRNAWHLVEIVTPTKNKLSFKYNLETITKYSKSDLIHNKIPSISIQKQIINQYEISEINFSGNKINFNYDNVLREDLIGSKSLKDITIYDKNQKQIKKIELLNSYTISNTNEIPTQLKLLDPNSHKRLFLNEIKFWDNNAEKSYSYKFDYNNKILPSIHSTSVDYWGYYNGANNNENLLTSENIRSVSSDYNEAGLLKKLIYPTNGSIELEYENNEVMVPSYFRELIIPDLKEDDNYYEDKNIGIFKGIVFYKPGYPGTYETTFSINIPINEKITLEYFSFLGEACNSVENFNCKTIVRLYNMTTGDVYSITNGNGNISGNLIKSGNYKLVVSNPNFTSEDSNDFEANNFMINIRWREIKDESSLLLKFLAGGKRIKSIKYNYSVGDSVKKAFEYKDSENITTGKLIGLPDFYYKSKELEGLRSSNLSNPAPLSSFNFGGDVGYSKVIEKTLDKNDNLKESIEYNFTNFEDGGEFYHHYFHVSDNMDWARGLNLRNVYRNSDNQIIKILENEYSFYYGNLSPYIIFNDNKNAEISNISSSSQIIDNNLKSIPYHYYKTNKIVAIPIYRFGEYKDPFDNDDFDNPDLYRIAFFLGGTINLMHSKNTEYLNGNPLVTTTNYFYDNPSHYQMTREETSLPDGTIQKKLYTYANEKGNQYLIDKNIVGIPLQTTVSKNNLGISSIETKYPISQTDADAKTNGLALPTSVISYGLQIPGASSSSKTEVTYDKYDDKGNILQYTVKGLQPTVIIWGYNQTQPIVKIEGKSYDALMALSGVSTLVNYAITKSNSDVDTATEQLLLTALDSLRTDSSLNAYMISTYTYDPLIGVTSITPPSGIREIYKYDSANRLQSVVDVNGKILKEYQYNYKQ